MKHARRICLLLAVLFMLTAIFTACEPGTGTETGEATDDGGDREDPNADYTVYHSICFAGDCVYYVNDCGSQKDLVFTLLDYPGETYHACQVPTCFHNRAADCEFIDVEPLCVVQREGELPIIYVQKGVMVYVYNLKTGGLKKVGRIDFSGVSDAWFYRDRLYMWTNGGVAVPGRPTTAVGSFDTVTGEFEYLKTDLRTRMLGIYSDRIWYINDRNMICSCALDFSDVREEYDVGIEEKTSDSEYRNTLRGYIDNGMIYFERNRREPKKFPGDAFINECNGGHDLESTVVSDICVLDADNIDAGERTVAEGVIYFKPKGGDLYYTKMDYDHYMESETYVYSGDILYNNMPDNETKTFRFDGGTLYRYDHESGKSETVVEDCGTNFSVLEDHRFGAMSNFLYDGIIEVTDDYVLFRGRQYRDLTDELKDRDCCNYICCLDLKTGEWSAVVPIAKVDFKEIL